VGEDGFEPPKV